VKTVALFVLVVAGSVGVEPERASVGQPIDVTGPPGRPVVLEPLDSNGRNAPLGSIGPGGTLAARVPDVPRGSYRVVVAGEGEAPVLEVTALSQGTSAALLAFGLLFVLGVVVAGVVVHRRWRDAIS
jgi:hypothetical protein